MANDPLDTLDTGAAAERVIALVRGTVYGMRFNSEAGERELDPGQLARVVVETLRGEPAALLAFAAEVTASLAAADLVPGYRRLVSLVEAGRCGWCGRVTLVAGISYQGRATGLRACGTCHATNRVCQPPVGHVGEWPPGGGE